MGESRRLALVVIAACALILAALGGYVARGGGAPIVVQSPNQQEMILQPDEAGERIEGLATELENTNLEVTRLKSELDYCKQQSSRLKDRVAEAESAVPIEEPPDERAQMVSGGIVVSEVKKAQGFEFTVKGCSVSGTDLECWISVLNSKERRELSIYGRSRLIDQEGVSHSSGLIASDGTWGGSLYITLDLPTNVRSKFGLRFEGLGGYVKSIPYLDIATEQFHVEWQDVPVG